MSQESRENAQEVQYQLERVQKHLQNAGLYADKVKDPTLRTKIKEATEKADTAHKHVKESLEGK